jgi:2-polyprenyl-6-methoxyphenol hydroxylase-like FAD-dependent oxidoreductase
MNFDVVIVGAGIGGLSAANALLAQGALSVAIVEGREVGSNNPSPLTFVDIVKEYELQDCAKQDYLCFSK